MKTTRILLLAALSVCLASATDHAGSVYPMGVETVWPGISPSPGESLLGQFTNFYQANATADGSGKSSVPGFHVRVGAVALKVVHDWGVHVLGGSLVSAAALPFVTVHMSAPFGSGLKAGFGNPDLEPVAIAYRIGRLHWWYGADVFTPGFSYKKTDLINIGQHNYAVAPTGAFTYLARTGTDVSSRCQYIFNGRNDAIQYQSGREFICDYAAMQRFGKRLSVGGNGFFYKQTTDDMENGVSVPGGNRGQTLGVGPQIQYHAGRALLIAKYEREVLVRNRSMGNSFWFEVGLPFGHGRGD